jgi:hypothetical protein
MLGLSSELLLSWLPLTGTLAKPMRMALMSLPSKIRSRLLPEWSYGVEPIQSARVGVDCSCASIPVRLGPLLGDLPAMPAGFATLTAGAGMPLARATGALLAFPNQFRPSDRWACQYCLPDILLDTDRVSSVDKVDKSAFLQHKTMSEKPST